MLRSYFACGATYMAASASVCAALTADLGWIRYALFTPLGFLAAGWVVSTALARSK